MNDFHTVLFAGAIITSMILMRKTIRRLNPGHVNGYGILNKGNELSVPNGVAVFELSNSAPMEILYKYIEVLRGMAIHPGILVIRFNKILRINTEEAHILHEVIIRLSADGVKIFFADVDMKLEKQFKKLKLVQKVGEDNIFYTIDDALNYAGKIIGIH